mgnify:CR=1 FL=1
MDKSGLQYSSPCPWMPEKSLGEVLITPTRIYVPAVLAACKTKKEAGFAHITGRKMPGALVASSGFARRKVTTAGKPSTGIGITTVTST